MRETLTASQPPAPSADVPLLSIQGLEAWYGESHVLHGIDFHVQPGEVVTLLGRNGAGKSTTLKAIMGVMDKRKGSPPSPLMRHSGRWETAAARWSSNHPMTPSGARCPPRAGLP